MGASLGTRSDFGSSDCFIWLPVIASTICLIMSSLGWVLADVLGGTSSAQDAQALDKLLRTCASRAAAGGRPGSSIGGAAALGIEDVPTEGTKELTMPAS